MMNKHGKHICNALKQVRLDIARANGIEYAPRECHHEGDCAGTCPACESEMRYLEREIARRRNLGRAAVVAGVSMSLSSLSAMASPASLSVPVMSGDHPASQSSDTTKVYQVVGRISESVPQFPGGDAALMRYLGANIKYPPELSDSCFQGRVVVNFLIDKAGQVAEVKVAPPAHELIERELVRVCKSLPRFEPARKDGEAIDFWYTLPISFKAQSVEKATRADALTRVNGTVLDENHEPIIGAAVTLLDNPKKGVATDFDGHFKLDVPNGSKVKVAYLGYEGAVVTASDGMIITLKPSDNVLLGEVCVVVKSRAKNAQYPGGDKALQKFIKKNFVFPTDFSGQEYVMIEVDVDKKGNVSNPRVLNNELGTAFEKEALRVADLVQKMEPARDAKGKKTASTFSIVFDSADWTD